MMGGESPSSLLIIRFSSLGDIVLTTPTIAMAKIGFRNARVYYLTFERYSGILEGNPYIDEIIAIKGLKGREGLKELLFIKEKVKNLGIELFIDLHSNLRTFILRRLIGGRWLVIDKRSLKRRLMVCFKIGVGREYPPIFKAGVELLRNAGIKEDVGPPSLGYLFKGERQRNKGSFIRVGIAPGAKWKTKMWPEENYRKLLKMIEENFTIEVHLFGDRAEEGLMRRIGAVLSKPPVIHSNLPLNLLPLTIGEMDIFISGDTGPMHIASACGLPQIAIFGPTVREFGFAPASPHVILLETELPCRPCSLHGSNSCPLEHFECMKSITAERVFEGFSSLVKGMRN